ncbi:MAG: hypothetical protein ACE5FG_03355 [Myxococcota bacterium]
MLVLLSACVNGVFDPKLRFVPGERLARLERAAEAYAEGLRWGDIERAAALVSPSRRAELRKLLRERHHAPRFTRVEVTSIELEPDGEHAKVRLSLDLYRPPVLHETSLYEEQTWQYVPESRAWYVVPDLALYRGDAVSER